MASSNFNPLLVSTTILLVITVLAHSAVILDKPKSSLEASIEHQPSFSSFSIEPAFWVEFAGTASKPNQLTLDVLTELVNRGCEPVIRPGGITMDSMVFDPAGGDPIRTMDSKGAIYRTTVGPAYFQSWSNFPPAVKFVSTLNFGNNSLKVAKDLAVASMNYQAGRVKFFELGNEPTNYPYARWKYSTEAYVKQWKDWTNEIAKAIGSATGAGSPGPSQRSWWASSAVTGNSNLKVRPADIIPRGIDSEGRVAEYSIHSYPFGSCSPKSAARATIDNLLNHTGLVDYADKEILPSAQAALNSGQRWTIGEFNSIGCSGKSNVSDTFTQALWLIDTQLIYAVRNASSVYLHQGATLVLQSSTQINTPGFSTYDILYPRDSEKHGVARTLPSYAALLLLGEIFGRSNVRIQALPTPNGLLSHQFSGYAIYQGDEVSMLVLLNMQPYYTGSSTIPSITLDITPYLSQYRSNVYLKRLSAPYVDVTDSSKVTWAGQSFEQGKPQGSLVTEKLSSGKFVKLRGSQAVLIFLKC